METHQIEGLKRYLKKKGGRNYYASSPSAKDQKWLDGVLYSNGILNTLVFNLLFS